MTASTHDPCVALVLAGGAARGAYEVGVVRYLVEEVARQLGRPVPFQILCGTSVGAINACALAAYADSLVEGVRRLERHWTQLRIAHVIRIDSAAMLAVVRSLVGRAGHERRGGLLDPTGLQRVVATAVPFARIHEQLRAGRLRAVTLSATHVTTGRTVVFVDRVEPGLPSWGRDPTIEARAVRLTASHALASAAVPFVFPPVPIDGHYFCDGGLRQNVPLSPARRLGADGMIVIIPKYAPPSGAPSTSGDAPPQAPTMGGDAGPPPPDEEHVPSPLFILGKALNALMLDRIENDMDRLRRITDLLEAGTRLYGPDFVARINRELGGATSKSMRPIQTVLIRASENIAALSVDFVSSPAFASRATGLVGRLVRRLADGETRESDLLSYLLFDGEFARQLIDLGWRDARARHDELCTFFERLAPMRLAREA